MKKIIMIILVMSTNVCLAQVVDDFNDNDLTNHPTWSGTVNHFIVNASQQLQLNNTVASTSYLTVPFQPDWSGELQWDFFVRQNFASSASNFGRVYLIADQANITQPLNGYYIQLGEAGANDAIELFRQSGSTHTSVCRSAPGIIAQAFSSRIRVNRSVSGAWSVLADMTGGHQLVEVAAGNAAFQVGNGVFGIFCTYTAGNANRFFYDDIYAGAPPGDTSPTLVDMSVIDKHTLQLVFSEALDQLSTENVDHFLIADNNNEKPTTASLQPGGLTINLLFNSPFVNGKLYQLHISGVADLSANVMSQTTTSFRYFEAIDPEYKDLVVNEFFPDPSPSIGLPLFEFIELYNRSSKPFNLFGWSISDATSKATLPEKYILPGQYLIIATTSATDFSSFGETLLIANLPTINNASDIIRLADPSARVIDSISFTLEWYHDEDKAQGGYSIERLSGSLPSNDPTTWSGSFDVTGGTPGKVNSVDGRNPDQYPPTVVVTNVIDENEIAITFNERIDTGTFTIVSVQLQPTVDVSEIQFDDDQFNVRVLLAEPLVNGELYEMLLTGVRDTAGNVMPPHHAPIRYFQSTDAKHKDIIISEIMSDPSPAVKLPEVEYIEIFNNSSHPFDMKGWMLCDTRDTTFFPAHIIPAKNYRILCSSANVDRLSVYARTIGIPSFPSISNTGEPLKILSPEGRTIDSVYFNSAWYKDDVKIDGGWSLELIDLNNPCGESGNWTSSQDERGGTPGHVNSVAASKPDLAAPQVITVNAPGEREIQLVFNEKLSKDLRLFNVDISSWSGEYVLSFKSISLDTIVVQLSEPLRRSVEYEIHLSDIRDCAGNLMDEEHSRITFALTEPAEVDDFIINEVLFNPLPNGVDFIELYNKSDKYIDLKGLRITNELTGSESVVETSIVVQPSQYVVLTPDTDILLNYYPAGKATSMREVTIPGLSDDEGIISISDSSGVTLCRLAYSDDRHNTILKTTEGISLERISFASEDESNWRSCPAPEGATPGYLNANARPDLQFNNHIQVIPPVISYRAADQFTQIGFQFDEPGYIGNVKVFDVEGRLIKEITNNALLGFAGFFRWDGDTIIGARARTGYYVVRFEVFGNNGQLYVYRRQVVMAP